MSRKWQQEYLDNDGFLYFGPKIFSYYDVRDKARNTKNKIRYMLNRTSQMFEYEGLPETIKQRDLELLNQTATFSTWLRANDGKVYAVLGSRGGQLDQNFMPTKAIVANPVIGDYELDIDKNCVIMPNDSTYIGLMPMLSRYCSQLSENELSMHMININSRIMKVFSAGDNTTIESAKKWLKDLEDGTLGVVVNPKWGPQSETGLRVEDFGSAGATSALLDHIEYEQYLFGSMLNEIGIRAPFNMKREALGDSEVSQMDMTLVPFVDDMLYNRQCAIDKINEMFNLDVKVKLASAWEDIHFELNHMEEVEKENFEIDESDKFEIDEEKKDDVEVEKEEGEYDREDDN